MDGSQVNYRVCYTPPGGSALAVAQALSRQTQRYWIERVFQQARQPLDLRQNQTRHWPAWQHHVDLTRRALHFRLGAQLEGQETIPYLSFASLKILLAQKPRKLLQGDEALLAAARKRAAYALPKSTAKPPV